MVLDKFRGVREKKGSDKKPSTCGRKQTSNKPHLKLVPPLTSKNLQEEVNNLTDQELLYCCINDKTTNTYWKEFSRRFNPLFDSCILKILYKKGSYSDDAMMEIADDISFAVMEKIHGKKLIEKALKRPNPIATLVTSIKNIVKSWVKKQQLQKKSDDTAVKDSMISLDKPIGTDPDAVLLGETIADPNTNPLFEDKAQEIREKVSRLLQTAETLPKIQRLVFKVSMMFYNSLDEEDIREISLTRSVTPSKIKMEINSIMDFLMEKNKQVEHQQNLLTIKFAYLERLHRKLHEMEKDFNTPENKLKEVNQEITLKTKQLNNLRGRSQKIDVYPTAEQVAHLLGIPKTKQKDVAVSLHRAKKTLKQMIGNVIKNKKSSYEMMSKDEKK